MRRSEDPSCQARCSWHLKRWSSQLVSAQYLATTTFLVAPGESGPSERVRTASRIPLPACEIVPHPTNPHGTLKILCGRRRYSGYHSCSYELQSSKDSTVADARYFLKFHSSHEACRAPV